MRTLSIYSLLMLVLLTACGGCQEINSPLNPTPDPKCRVATQTVKNLIGPNQTSTEGIETVTIEGESYRVSTTKKSVYTYDTQGRILTEHNTYPDNKADSVLYSYTPGAVSIRTIKLTDKPKTERSLVWKLDSLGFSEWYSSSNKATYDREGYLLTLRNEYGETIAKIKNGNIVEFLLSYSPTMPSYTIKTEYDLNRPGLIPIQSFFGKASRNLPIKETVDNNNFSYEPFYNVHSTIWSYTFDNDNRVGRQISRGKDGEVGYIFGGLRVKVNDFTYICP